MPEIHPYHQLLIIKAINRREKSNPDNNLTGSELRRLAEIELSLSYNTLRKFFLKPSGSMFFQEYILNRLVAHICTACGEDAPQSDMPLWHNFTRIHPVPDFGKEIPLRHYLELEKEHLDLIEEAAKNILPRTGQYDYRYGPEKQQSQRKQEQLLTDSPLPPDLEGIYAWYKMTLALKHIEKRRATIDSLGNITLETPFAHYTSRLVRYTFPSLFVMLESGRSVISLHLFAGHEEQTELLTGTYSYFNSSDNTPTSGLIVLRKLSDRETDDFAPIVYIPGELIDNQNDSLIVDYLRTQDEKKLQGARVNTLEKLRHLLEVRKTRKATKELEIIEKFYTGSYYLYGPAPESQGVILKTPCSISSSPEGELAFELWGRTYHFRSASMQLRKNLLYIEIENIWFDDRGMFVLSLPSSLYPEKISGIAVFIDANNRPVGQRILLIKQQQNFEADHIPPSDQLRDNQENNLNSDDIWILDYFRQNNHNLMQHTPPTNGQE